MQTGHAFVPVNDRFFVPVKDRFLCWCTHKFLHSVLLAATCGQFENGGRPKVCMNVTL